MKAYRAGLEQVRGISRASAAGEGGTEPMKRIVVIVGALSLCAGGVMAQQDQVKDTQAMMKGNGKNAAALTAMVKGEKPYDQATVDAALAQFDETAKKLPTLFPVSLKGKTFDGDYQTTEKIWSDK